MAVKNDDAFRTISEVAHALDLPQHVLRFWESRFSQVRPMKRGGGRRYYRPEDVALLTGVRTLLYDEGFTIKGVQKILRERGVQHVSRLGRGEVTAEPSAAEAAPQEIAEAIEDRDDALPGRAALEAALEELSALKTILDRARG
jgi:DNA-binding transcriptional MerR regulator